MKFVYKGKQYVANSAAETASLPVRFVCDPYKAFNEQTVHILVVYHQDWDVTECGTTCYAGDWRDAQTSDLHVWQVCGECGAGFARLQEQRAKDKAQYKVQEVA